MNKEEARKAMIAKRFGGNVAGAGSSAGCTRRKKVAHAKVSSTDDKKITGNLKKMGLQNIPDIDEVNLFKDNGEVIHFVKPKVQAALPSKTFVISGNSEDTTIDALMPQILTQMGDLSALAKTMGAGGGDDEGPPELVEDDDEDMPELVEEN